MGLGKEPLVQIFALARHCNCCHTDVARHYMSADHLGDETEVAGRRHNLLRLIYCPLAKQTSVLQRTTLGLFTSVYTIYCSGGFQLVFYTSSKIQIGAVNGQTPAMVWKLRVGE